VNNIIENEETSKNEYSPSLDSKLLECIMLMSLLLLVAVALVLLSSDRLGASFVLDSSI
jgi:hypothetical protein